MMLDLDFFKNQDRVLQLLTERDVTAHLMIFVGNKHVEWPKELSVADDIYWKHVLARYGAYNVVLDSSKESNRFDSDYMVNRLRLINSINPHNRLVTAHTGIPKYGYNNCPEDLCSMITRQKHFDGDVTAQAPQYYNDTIMANDAHPVPVINAEFFYEAGVDRICNGSAKSSSHTTCAQTADEVKLMRKAAWDIYMAGGAATWYHCDISWDYIKRATTSVGMHWMNLLSAFWSTVDFTELEPRDDLLLLSSSSSSSHVTVHCAASANEFVVYAHSSSASFSLDVPVGLSGEWFDPTSGDRVPVTTVVGTLTPPFAEDAVLHLRTASPIPVPAPRPVPMPVPVPSPSRPQYLGCYYEDPSDRDLPSRHGSGDVYYCQQLCVADGYHYFGQHWTRECWCGSSYGKHGEAPNCNCDSERMDKDRNCVYSAGLNDFLYQSV